MIFLMALKLANRDLSFCQRFMREEKIEKLHSSRSSIS